MRNISGVLLWVALQLLPVSGRGDADGLSTLCRKEEGGAELKVRCTDGKSWTVKSAGLVLPPVLRCSSKQPECCQTGYRGMRDMQLADLIRVGEGRPPVCHILVSDFLKNAPAVAEPAPAVPQDLTPDEVPGVRRKVRRPVPAPPRTLPVPEQNQVLVPEAQDVIHRMRLEFNRTGRCPQNALDIGVLQRIYLAAEQRSLLLPGVTVDLSPLIAHPREPRTSHPDASLPVSCGYNATFDSWYQNSFHCLNQSSCYNQSNEGLMHACVRFERDAGDPFLFPADNCQHIPACRDVLRGQCTGTARLTALGEAIYLMIQETPNGDPYYYGVIFAR